jgi:thiamine-phosphate pyrophosphorylase
VFPRLYAIIDASLLSGSELPKNDSGLAIAQMLANSGVELIQYRDKRSNSRQYYEVSLQFAQALANTPARFIVNDRPDIALLTGAGGVHVGQTDLSVEDARAICGVDRWVGVSTHNLEQLREADKTSANYIAFGPVFATATKQNPDPVVGLEHLREARRLTRKPLVAIGGMTLDRAAEVYAAGADSICVARDLLRSPDPAACARAYLRIASEAARP